MEIGPYTSLVIEIFVRLVNQEIQEERLQFPLAEIAQFYKMSQN